MTLKDLKIGKYAEVLAVGGEGNLRQHFLDMGVIPGTVVKMIKRAPMGDPLEILVQGYSLTLRGAEADKIEVRAADAPDSVQAEKERPIEEIEHPGFGEEGKYHQKEHEHKLPEGTVLTFALAGQQNCGKTTLFNQLTGSNQHVGNFPGVTVDRKDGQIKGHPNTVVTDLPGIYSLST